MTRPVQLVGEILVGHESCASYAISRVLKQLNYSSAKFEAFFKDFGLSIQEWKALDVDYCEDHGFFVAIEAVGGMKKGVDGLEGYIQEKSAELYLDVNGFVPTMVNV